MRKKSIKIASRKIEMSFVIYSLETINFDVSQGLTFTYAF